MGWEPIAIATGVVLFGLLLFSIISSARRERREEADRQSFYKAVEGERLKQIEGQNQDKNISGLWKGDGTGFFGVGRRLVNHRLAGQDERFAKGEVVWFSTRVLGGRPGDSVRHVWLYEGRGVQSVDLELGGPDWRTWSRKTLQDPGQWTVEARDGEGLVLARATFACAPRGP